MHAHAAMRGANRSVERAQESQWLSERMASAGWFQGGDEQPG